jgi:N-acetyl-gamma-glutamyl-phosphate reductase
MLKIGLYGASGYTGLELAGIIARHPAASLAFATSRQYAGQSLQTVSPRAPDITLVKPDAVSLQDIDLAFLCLPHAAAAETALNVLDSGTRVIDLSADFRLTDAQIYEKWYKKKHPRPDLLDEAVYGLTEQCRDRLPDARLVANPGCYPTCVLLPLIPLLQLTDKIAAPIVADVKSGVTGAGRKPKPHTMFAELAENFFPYKIGQNHRHFPEIRQQLKRWSAGSKVAPPQLLFTPHLLPVIRGMLATIYVTFDRPVQKLAAENIVRKRYAAEPFVDVLDADQTATLSHVAHTNCCALSMTACENTLVLVSAIDNLLKGAAGQAVQNMNVMFGIPETTGLKPDTNRR